MMRVSIYPLNKKPQIIKSKQKRSPVLPVLLRKGHRMCGVTGILNFNKAPVVEKQLKAMTDVIAHRGPDGEGQWLKSYVGLGHRRLSIIDLSRAGHQPMQTKDGRYILTYNGEVYNFKELRIELESLGYEFYSNTDSEVVLNAFAEWQEKCVRRFNGMFAFSIWDKKDQKLFLARDRYGIKPLYYYKTNQTIVFGSEIKAIIKSGLYKPSLDKEALVEYLTFQNFFTDKTLFKDIQILMPGNYAYIELSGKISIQQYWDFNFTGNLKISRSEVVEETDRLCKQAVQRQLVGDVPINSYLSGGIDSGAITMLASKMLPHMKTFTIGFDLSSASGLELAFDERESAEHVSYLAQTEHYEMVLKAGDMERCMNNYVWHLEEPRVGQSYPNYYAAKLANKFGKVVLSGCGGDELFGGYPWRYQYTTKPTAAFDSFLDSYYLKWHRLISNVQLKKLLHPIGEEIKHVWTKDIFNEILKPVKKKTMTPEEALNASLYLEAKTFLHGLLIVEDKVSMAHSLETRVPFLDNDLVDFSLKVPVALKIKTSEMLVNENDLHKKQSAFINGKIILREALSRYLDSKIIQAKKRGFSSPDASWFRGESIDYIKSELKNIPNYLDKTVFREIIEEHMNGQNNNRLTIWAFLYLKKFGEIFL